MRNKTIYFRYAKPESTFCKHVHWDGSEYLLHLITGSNNDMFCESIFVFWVHWSIKITSLLIYVLQLARKINDQTSDSAIAWIQTKNWLQFSLIFGLSQYFGLGDGLGERLIQKV